MNTNETTTVQIPAWVSKINSAPADVECAYQLGVRQHAAWATLTDAQRREANVLMASTGTTASKAIAAVKVA